MPPKILDTHIHLWPSTALTPKNHAWMTDPPHILTKRHGISDYLRVAPDVDGFVYVETDRYLPSALPDINIDGDEVDEEALRVWCKEPLEEIKFLRRVVEGEADEEIDGVGTGQEERMKGVVLFAPFHLLPRHFLTYMRIARETAGSALWRKVVGFRYLLQGKGEGEVERLALSEDWISNLLSLSKSAEHSGKSGGWVFEVGADVHRDGTAGLEAIVKMVREVRKRESDQAPVRFVLNHLCKPPLTYPQNPPPPAYIHALNALGADKHVYMKLSGALNEFKSQPTPPGVSQVVTALTPVLDQVFKTFPGRIMFGSDWPVCNVGGPAGEAGNWMLWRDVVAEIGTQRGFGDEEMSGIWSEVGKEVYLSFA